VKFLLIVTLIGAHGAVYEHVAGPSVATIKACTVSGEAVKADYLRTEHLTPDTVSYRCVRASK
jgi:hypothetical protein